VDGRALRRAQQVLLDGGVVGIFPEGGIWTDGPKDTQRGVAWLAAQTGAPVIPMGFAGIDEGLVRTFSLQFPRFEVHVGSPLSYGGGAVTRSALDDFSRVVMKQVDGLLPDWDRAKKPRPTHTEYWLELHWQTESGGSAETEIRNDPEAAVISRFYHLPVLLSIFEINLRRNVEALKAWETPQSAGEIERAINRILGYIALRNKHLFTYRLGPEKGELLVHAFRAIRDRLRELPADSRVLIVPVARRTWPDGRTEILRDPIE
jgi:1-acyl-sn-glycerol-3-phosphate acyltransferase